MSSIFIFPGQGSQTVGMGKDLYDKFPAARAVFEEVDDALHQKLSTVIFNGPMEELTLTANVQPAIMAVSIAMLRVWETNRQPFADYRPPFVAGHSLGEYTALCAAGALSLADTARLLRTRGDAMQDAVPVGRGMVSVILGLDIDTVREICMAADCDVANDNAPGQVVISGLREPVEKAMGLAKERGAKRAMPLPLSAPVHCRLQAAAADKIRDALDRIEMRAPTVPLISNKTCAAMSDVNEIKDALVYQITHGVRWRETILTLPSLGIAETIEIGPGTILTGLTPRIAPTLDAKKLEI
ncbi:MAG: ACP S-malonyltransferase [Rickettsiales bacterium]|jgi:[acyl-carrier-protein] S-malonyltransferase|nr:ACP S-malonyltransferase [Rickettsiales bacterium]